MKDKENIKSTLALCFSIAAILLCLLVFALWAFEMMPHSVITAESFIGACVALLGVIVTIAVGWQIFNVIEMRQMMRELEEKQKNINEAQRKLDEEVQENYRHSMHLHHMTLAMQQEAAHQYAPAIFYYFGALYAGIDLHKQDDNNEFIWAHVKACLNQLTGVTKVPAKMYKDIEDVDALIRASKQYHWFRAEYEPLFEEYKTKIQSTSLN